jgi:hypothetical protein
MGDCVRVTLLEAQKQPHAKRLMVCVIGWRQELADKTTRRRIRRLGRESQKCEQRPHLSGAPQKYHGAIIFPERTWSCPDDAVLGAFRPHRILAKNQNADLKRTNNQPKGYKTDKKVTLMKTQVR